MSSMIQDTKSNLDALDTILTQTGGDFNMPVPCKIDMNKVKTFEELKEIVDIAINAWKINPAFLEKDFIKKYATDEFLNANAHEYSDLADALKGE